MTIRLDLTKRQLSYIVAAMSWHLRKDDITKTIRDPENGWSFKISVAREFAERCELLAMLDRTFNSSMEEQDDD